MSDFTEIFGDVLRIVTFQPREARMRYQGPQWDERMEAPKRKDSRERVERGDQRKDAV
jgi:hypothetical protein